MRATLSLALLLSACDAGSSARPSVPGPGSQPIPPDAPSAPLPPSSSASSPAEPVTSPEKLFSELRAKFPDEPPWRSGAGVACGAATCKKGDLCCADGERSKCMPKGREKECWKTGAVVFCDESSDCAEADRCCAGATDEGMLTTCASKKRCSTHWDRPGGRMIPAVEVCARGGSCKTEGAVCAPAANSNSVSGGQCVSERARVAACESKSDCPPERPWCFWDSESKRGVCIPRGPWLREEGVLECDSHADCPGGMCCSGNAQTFCSAVECYPALAYAAIVCRTAKDCGEYERNVPDCGPEERLPDGLGTCGWISPPGP